MREQVARGVDIIKLGIIDSREFPLRGYLPILEAAINEGHQLGVRVAVHAEELKAAKAAVRAGADLLAHTVNDQLVDNEFIQMVEDRDVIAVTSLGVDLGYARVLMPTGTTDLLEVERVCGDQEVIRFLGTSWGRYRPIKGPPYPIGFAITALRGHGSCSFRTSNGCMTAECGSP